MWVLARDLDTVLGTLDPKWILENAEEGLYVQPRANDTHPRSSFFLVRTDKYSEGALCLGRRRRQSVGQCECYISLLPTRFPPHPSMQSFTSPDQALQALRPRRISPFGGQNAVGLYRVSL